MRREIPAVRILPMSGSMKGFRGLSIEEVQNRYFLRDLPSRKGRYRYPSSGGVARDCGLLGIIGPHSGGSMDWNKLTDDEKLIAEQAVAMARAVKRAGDRAPHGKGLFCLEQAVLDHGRELLRLTLERSAASHAEAQKKG